MKPLRDPLSPSLMHEEEKSVTCHCVPEEIADLYQCGGFNTPIIRDVSICALNYAAFPFEHTRGARHTQITLGIHEKGERSRLWGLRTRGLVMSSIHLTLGFVGNLFG
jgi:hypothetical protein